MFQGRGKEGALRLWLKPRQPPFFRHKHMQVQQELERRTGKAVSVFVDMSVSETIYNLIVLASDVAPGRAQEFLQEAQRVQKRFKVREGGGGLGGMLVQTLSPMHARNLSGSSFSPIHASIPCTNHETSRPCLFTSFPRDDNGAGAGEALLVREDQGAGGLGPVGAAPAVRQREEQVPRGLQALCAGERDQGSKGARDGARKERMERGR